MLKGQKMSEKRKRHLSIIWKGKRKGKDNPHWKTGKWIDRDGYVMIYVSNHPFKTYGSYVREHRIVMEKFLGRYLERREVVHHINGDNADNRLENLILFSNHGKHISKHNHNRHRDKKGRFID